MNDSRWFGEGWTLLVMRTSNSPSVFLSACLPACLIACLHLSVSLFIGLSSSLIFNLFPCLQILFVHLSVLFPNTLFRYVLVFLHFQIYILGLCPSAWLHVNFPICQPLCLFEIVLLWLSHGLQLSLTLSPPPSAFLFVPDYLPACHLAYLSNYLSVRLSVCLSARSSV